MKILIRADASSRIGHGHIMRDLVLARQLAGKHEIIFATMDLPGNINHKIEQSGYSLYILTSNSSDELVEVIGLLDIDMVIFDHYDVDEQFEKEIKEKSSVKILSFDDTYERHHCDILLNHNPGANKKKYSAKVPENCVNLCGTRFTLIRDEFKDLVTKRVQKIRDKKKISILVMMGGSDPLNITCKIAKELSKNRNYQLSLVTTTSNVNLNRLRQLVKIHKNIVLHVNSTKISQLMQSADLAIISPSVSAAEAMYMKLPFIAIQTADNQSAIFNYLRENRLPVIRQYNAHKLSLEVEKAVKNHENLVRRLHAFHFSTLSLEPYL